MKNTSLRVFKFHLTLYIRWLSLIEYPFITIFLHMYLRVISVFLKTFLWDDTDSWENGYSPRCSRKHCLPCHLSNKLRMQSEISNISQKALNRLKLIISTNIDIFCVRLKKSETQRELAPLITVTFWTKHLNSNSVFFLHLTMFFLMVVHFK